MAIASTHDLRGSVVLVTGASGHIGQAICAAMSAAGAQVVATNSSCAPGDLQAHTWMRHDVTSAAEWGNVIARIQEQFGRLDCLINNAGVCLLASVADTSLEAWRRTFSVNVESVLFGMQAALPLLRLSGENRIGGSSIVNISSTAGIRGVGFFSAYCASKGAMTLLTISAAKEFATLRYPIRVNSVHPGTVASTMMDSNLRAMVGIGMAQSIDTAKSLFISRNPMGRMGLPEEIAGAVVFLCSPAASYMTGSRVVIDGAATA